MERDTRLAQAEKQLLKKKKVSAIEDIMQLTEFQDMKMRIEWDVAWRIFDHVNEGNDTTKYIDLHCLDVFEAESITKQCIYEAARMVQNEGNKGLFSMNLFCTSDPRPSFKESVFCIKCSNEHVINGENRMISMLKNDFDYLDYYLLPEQNLILVKIDSGTIAYNKVMRDW